VEKMFAAGNKLGSVVSSPMRNRLVKIGKLVTPRSHAKRIWWEE
jgi:hypothetical protein